MIPKSSIAYLINAIRKPQRRNIGIGFWRSLLLQPRIFDFASTLLQLKDYSRLDQISNQTHDDTYYQKVHNYNSSVTVKKTITKTRRADFVYQALLLPPRDLSHEKLLIVGPRNIHELYTAWLHGYRWENIQAIDLYSTNSKIVTMNMESMEFPDEHFDVVTMVNALSYAKDTFVCLSEVYRVLKPGGRFLFNSTYSPQVDNEWNGDRISGSEIYQMLKNLSMEIFSYYPFDKSPSDINNTSGKALTSHFFYVRKTDPSEFKFDRFEW